MTHSKVAQKTVLSHQVDRCPRHVEHDVVDERGLGAERLEEARRLLLVVSDLSSIVQIWFGARATAAQSSRTRTRAHGVCRQQDSGAGGRQQVACTSVRRQAVNVIVAT